jgi:hypothetical protein
MLKAAGDVAPKEKEMAMQRIHVAPVALGLGLCLVLAGLCVTGCSDDSGPTTETVCNDNEDNDGDGDTDCDDADCMNDVACQTATEILCNDSQDNDGDGDTDCDDEDCVDDPACQTETTTIEGRVWVYRTDTLSPSGIGLDWGSNAEITTVGLTPEITATADTEGVFTLTEVPVGETIYVRATGYTNATSGVTHSFTVSSGQLLFVVLVSDDLLDAVETAWGVTIDSTNGLLVGTVASWDPVADPPIGEYFGGASVTISPTITDPDFEIIYLNPNNLTDTSLVATDPDQAIFFGLNLTPSTGLYTLTTTDATETYPDVDFPVEADAVTNVVVSPID